MKVPKGKTVYYGSKVLKAGAEISDDLAVKLGLKKESKPPGKPAPAGGGASKL